MDKTNEEVVNEEVVNNEEHQENEVVEPSPVEVAARESGWVTKDEWIAQGKDPDDWRTAREFQERGELFEEIHKLKESNKKTSNAFKVLVEHHKKVYDNAVKEAIDRLKAEKREALENNEVSRVLEIDEQIEQVRERKLEVPDVEVDEEVGPTPTFNRWHKQNPWYKLTGDDEASRYADVIGAQYKKANPEVSERDLLEHVESKIARRFPEIFENPNGKRGHEVNPKGENKSSGTDNFKLTEEEERVCKMFVDQGVMTRKEYIDDLKKMRGRQ
jgi:hypothetical protein